jgi:arylsulfatase A-like enzyme
MSLHQNRRDFVRTATGAAAVLAAAGCGDAQPTKPNIVLIMADDMGFSDIGCYGGEIETPVIDSLAHDGLRFRQFYNTARCCPTRASLMTGLYPHQAGVGHMMTPYFKDGEAIPSYQGELNEQCVTIAEALKPAGYTTLMSGKWHVTPAEGSERTRPVVGKHDWPRQRGFDRFFGTIHGAGSFYDPVSLTLDNDPIEPEGDDFYYTTAIGEHGAQFVEEAPRDKPFFLYLPFTAPHWPLHAPDEDVAHNAGRYDIGWDELRQQRQERMVQMGVVSEDWALTERDATVPAWEDAPNKEWEARRMEVYAAQITAMDRAIGTVTEKLKELDIFEDTLILFLADNGGCAEILRIGATAHHMPTETLDGRPMKIGNDPNELPGQDDDYQSYGPAWANTSNTPFRRYKHWVHEGGISSPLIAHWPNGEMAAGAWTDEPSHLIDIMATCVDVAGASYPIERQGQPVQPAEGRSFAPLFHQESAGPERTIYWEHEGNRAVRQGRWKLVSKWSAPESGRWELYDMESDRTEMHDLSSGQSARVSEMAAGWQVWANRVGVVEWRSWDDVV